MGIFEPTSDGTGKSLRLLSFSLYLRRPSGGGGSSVMMLFLDSRAAMVASGNVGGREEGPGGR